MAKKRLRSTKEDVKGRNIEFEDTKTKRKVFVEKVIENIKKGGKYSEDYYINKTGKGREYPASKPDGKKGDNLD